MKYKILIAVISLSTLFGCQETKKGDTASTPVEPKVGTYSQTTTIPEGILTPDVVETSIGLDRMFLSIVSNAYTEEIVEATGEQRVVMKIPAVLAPVKLAVLPLTKKDGLPEKAREIIDVLKFDFNCHYEVKDTIGRRYRRQDAIGTPFCITIDHQTLQDDTVTIRYRDTMEQERVPVSKLEEIMSDKVSLKELLKTL